LIPRFLLEDLLILDDGLGDLPLLEIFLRGFDQLGLVVGHR
jgi:hypothetical protein